MRIETLLVEDNPADARMIRELLRDGGGDQIVLTHTDRLDTALETLIARKPDAVILDLSLPDSKGLATFRSIQGRIAGVPIVVLTGLDDIELAVQAIGEGAADYLLKHELSGALLVRALRYAIERKRTEESLRIALRQKEVLLQEVHHRVKNNLQIITSLLSLEAEDLPPVAQRAFEESQRRVQSMALLHDQLYRTDHPDRLDFREYVSVLIHSLFTAHHGSSGPIELRQELDPVLLNLDQAMPCGLILNELLTNSLKHAFPGDRRGEVLVALHCRDDGQVALRVADNGIGLPPGFDWRQSSSLGLRIVNILAGQLNGTVKLAAAGGADFTLAFARIFKH